MSEPTHVALPEDEYLTLVGQYTYMVASIEWTLLGDLASLHARGIAVPNVAELASMTTATIGRRLQGVVDHLAVGAVRSYLAAGAKLLIEVAPTRNALAHARPATASDGSQRLYRWTAREQFLITPDWLRAAIRTLDQEIVALDAARTAAHA